MLDTSNLYNIVHQLYLNKGKVSLKYMYIAIEERNRRSWHSNLYTAEERI